MFTVGWVRSALDDLADIWTQADAGDRAAISAAANRIDRLLSTNPSDQGESRSKARRLLVELPLVVVFEIVEQDRFVRVLQVRRPKKRRGP
jgi:plasmid stabilization system protein ParE